MIGISVAASLRGTSSIKNSFVRRSTPPKTNVAVAGWHVLIGYLVGDAQQNSSIATA